MWIELLLIDAHHLDDGEDLRGEGFVDLDNVDVAQLQTRALKHFAHGWYGSNAHIGWINARYRHCADLCQRSDTLFACLLRRHQDYGGGAIVERAGIARGDGSTFDKGRFQAG